jgi:hypothetical protein
MILTNVISPKQSDKAICVKLEAPDGHLTDIWLPKTHCTLNGTTLKVADWLYKATGFERLINRNWHPHEFFISSAPIEKISSVSDGTYKVKLPDKPIFKFKVKTPDNGYPMIGLGVGRTTKYFGSIEGKQLRFWDKFLSTEFQEFRLEIKQAWNQLKEQQNYK